eukprot:g56070.t1
MYMTSSSLNLCSRSSPLTYCYWDRTKRARPRFSTKCWGSELPCLPRLLLKPMRRKFWDVPGTNPDCWELYYARNVKGIIFIVDSTNETILDDAKNLLNNVLELPGMDNVALLVMANKQDLANAVTAQEIEDNFFFGAFEEMRRVVPTSTLTGSNRSDATNRT